MRQYRTTEIAQQLKAAVMARSGTAQTSDRGVIIKVAGNEALIPRQDARVGQRIARNR